MIGCIWGEVTTVVARLFWRKVRALVAWGQKKHTRPRDLAYWRLSQIIAADRAAVPCGRWVWQFNRIGPARGRPRYRYEVRR